MDHRTGSHSIYNVQVHVVWITKYRYPVLTGEIQLRCRDILRQVCNALDIQILNGVVSKDHIHLHISYPPRISIIPIKYCTFGCHKLGVLICWFYDFNYYKNNKLHPILQISR